MKQLMLLFQLQYILLIQRQSRGKSTTCIDEVFSVSGITLHIASQWLCLSIDVYRTG